MLRQAFLEARTGITGVNMAVAETGTLMLVESEGNIRMCTSLPRRHIALMGIEKVVRDWEGAAHIMQMLPLAAHGKPAATYTSLITGVGGDDGPDELHLVLVDDGRSALRGTDLESALHCIRCGACLYACPVYRQVGGHAYGAAYSGPIGAVITPALEQSAPPSDELPWLSSLCGACTDACPVGIPLDEHLVTLRSHGRTPGRDGVLGRLGAAVVEAVVLPRTGRDRRQGAAPALARRRLDVGLAPGVDRRARRAAAGEGALPQALGESATALPHLRPPRTMLPHFRKAEVRQRTSIRAEAWQRGSPRSSPRSTGPSTRPTTPRPRSASSSATATVAAHPLPFLIDAVARPQPTLRRLRDPRRTSPSPTRARSPGRTTGDRGRREALLAGPPGGPARASDLVASVAEALARWRDDPPTNVVFAAGPSRTADIEQTMMLGVHAPRSLDVVLYG